MRDDCTRPSMLFFLKSQITLRDKGGFGERLRLKAWTPFVLLVLVSGLIVAGSVLQDILCGPPLAPASEHVDLKRRRSIAWKAWLSTLPASLAILFTLVSGVSSRVFSTWSCRQCESP